MLDTYYRLKAKFAIYVWKYVLDSFGYIFVLVIVVYASIFLVTKTSNKKTREGGGGWCGRFGINHTKEFSI